MKDWIAPFAEQVDLRLPLAERQEQREEDRREQCPVREGRPRREPAGDHPQEEPARDAEHVDEHDVLQPHAVEQVHQQVPADDERDAALGGAGGEAQGERGEQAERRGHERRGHRR